jgi:hypothetical protein
MADGSPYMVFMTGVVQIIKPDGGVRELAIVKNQGLSSEVSRIDNNRVIFGFNSDSGAFMSGAVLFDDRRPDATTEIPLPANTTYVLGVGDHLAVLHDGVISQQDFAGKQVAEDFTPPHEASAIVGTYYAPVGGY